MYFVVGAQLIGSLECSGIGTPMDPVESPSPEVLWSHRHEANQELLSSLKSDARAVKRPRVRHALSNGLRMTCPFDSFAGDFADN